MSVANRERLIGIISRSIARRLGGIADPDHYRRHAEAALDAIGPYIGVNVEREVMAAAEEILERVKQRFRDAASSP